MVAWVLASAAFWATAGTPGTNLFGNIQTELFTGPWQVGERIIGVGVQYMGADVADTLYFNPDWEGHFQSLELHHDHLSAIIVRQCS